MKLLLVDDHALVREGIGRILLQSDQGIDVIEAADGRQALQRVDAELPGLVLLNLALPDMSGLDALARILDRHPALPVVMLSASESPDEVIEAIRRGARGFVPKSTTSHTLMAALRLVLDGHVYLPPSVFVQSTHSEGVCGQPIAQRWPEQAPLPAPARLGLTERQTQVLRFIMQGRSNKQIARDLCIAEGTVKAHVAVVLRALRVVNRVQAILAVARLGIRVDMLAPSR